MECRIEIVAIVNDIRKSLLISTMRSLFEGRRDLFEGLAIEPKWDWTKTWPVLHLDMGSCQANTLEGVWSAMDTMLTCETPAAIWLIEFKLDRSADEALDQIDRNGYAEKFDLSSKRVIKIGIAFSSEKRTITDVKIG